MPCLGGRPFLPGQVTGSRVEHAAGRQPDQQVHGLPGQRRGQRGGAVPGVEDDQRRARPPCPAACRRRSRFWTCRSVWRVRVAAVVRSASTSAAQAVRRWPSAASELVLPARDGLAGAVAAAGVMMHVVALRRALGIGPGVGGGVDREPQPPPPRARLPYLRCLVRGQAGQRGFQQAVVDQVVLAGPGLALVPVDQRGSVWSAARQGLPRRSGRRPARHTARRARGGTAPPATAAPAT